MFNSLQIQIYPNRSKVNWVSRFLTLDYLDGLKVTFNSLELVLVGRKYNKTYPTHLMYTRSELNSQTNNSLTFQQELAG